VKGIWPVKTGCWFVGGDDLTEALHDLWLQWSSCHHHLRRPLLQWTPASPGSPGKWPAMMRNRSHQSCMLRLRSVEYAPFRRFKHSPLTCSDYPVFRVWGNSVC